jgi:hypothetical protein
LKINEDIISEIMMPKRTEAIRKHNLEGLAANQLIVETMRKTLQNQMPPAVCPDKCFFLSF